MHNWKPQLQLEKGENRKQKESAKGFIKEQTLVLYIDKLKASLLFITENGKTLRHVFSQTEVSPAQAESLLHYREYGTEDMNNYIECFFT